MKKIIASVMMVSLLLCTVFSLPVSAAEMPMNEVTTTTIEYLENGDYIETVLTVYETNSRAATKQGTKTSNYKNSSGTVLWCVTVYGSFTYNGTTSSCTSVSRSTESFNSNWTIKSSSCTKSGNCASATATAKYTSGSSSMERSLTVNLYCSPYGIIS
ncbi:MAG: hypothetical protein IJD19_01410 [Ruminococcus sp.]|nr:hypothetical protein [Ruminococcus sp.]